MPLIQLTPELIEKNHWRYQNIIHKKTNTRIRKIIKYSRLDIDDLALLLDVSPITFKHYMQDYTQMPLKKIWLLGQILNVSLDCFPDIGWWHDYLLTELPDPKEPTKH